MSFGAAGVVLPTADDPGKQYVLKTNFIHTSIPPVKLQVGGVVLTLGPNLIAVIGVVRNAIKCPLPGGWRKLGNKFLTPTRAAGCECSSESLCCNIGNCSICDSDLLTTDGSKACQRLDCKCVCCTTKHSVVVRPSVYLDGNTLFLDACGDDFKLMLHFLRRGEISLDYIEQHMSYVQFLTLFDLFDVDVVVERCFHCLTVFNPAINTLQPCLRHIGQPVVSNKAPSYWSCCKRPCINIDTYGRHHSGQGCSRSVHISDKEVDISPGGELLFKDKVCSSGIREVFEKMGMQVEPFADTSNAVRSYCKLGVSPLPQFCNKCPHSSANGGSCAASKADKAVVEPTNEKDQKNVQKAQDNKYTTPTTNSDKKNDIIPNSNKKNSMNAGIKGNSSTCTKSNAGCGRTDTPQSICQSGSASAVTQLDTSEVTSCKVYCAAKQDCNMASSRSVTEGSQQNKKKQKKKSSSGVPPPPDTAPKLMIDGVHVGCEKCIMLNSCKAFKANDGSPCPLGTVLKLGSNNSEIAKIKQAILKDSRDSSKTGGLTNIELKDPLANFWVNYQKTVGSGSKHKTKICPLYKLELCPLGSANCKFAHSFQELRFTDDLYKTQLCSFWQKGKCRAGVSCRHAHGNDELRKLKAVPVPPEECTGLVLDSPVDVSLREGGILNPDETAYNIDNHDDDDIWYDGKKSDAEYPILQGPTDIQDGQNSYPSYFDRMSSSNCGDDKGLLLDKQVVSRGCVPISFEDDNGSPNSTHPLTCSDPGMDLATETLNHSSRQLNTEEYLLLLEHSKYSPVYNEDSSRSAQVHRGISSDNDR